MLLLGLYRENLLMININDFYFNLNAVYHFLTKNDDVLVGMINEAQKGDPKNILLGKAKLVLTQTHSGLKVTLTGLPDLELPQGFLANQWSERNPLMFIYNNLGLSTTASALSAIKEVLYDYLTCYSDTDFKTVHRVIELGLRRRLELEGKKADWFRSKTFRNVELVGGPETLNRLNYLVTVDPKVLGGTLNITVTGYSDELGVIQYPEIRL